MIELLITTWCPPSNSNTDFTYIHKTTNLEKLGMLTSSLRLYGLWGSCPVAHTLFALLEVCHTLPMVLAGLHPVKAHAFPMPKKRWWIGWPVTRSKYLENPSQEFQDLYRERQHERDCLEARQRGYSAHTALEDATVTRKVADRAT